MTESLFSAADPPTGALSRVDLARVWELHAGWLKTVLAARGVERSAVEEVLQEVMTEAYRSVERLRDAAKLGPWLYRIAVLQALQYRRRLGRRRKLMAAYAERCAAEQWATVAPDPLGWLLAEEQRQIVREALGQLARRDAEILLLKYTEGWSYRELAARLGLSEAAVEARLHRARGRLRKLLARRL